MAKKAKKAKQPGFTVDSTQYCDACKRAIHVGLGGDRNWQTHAASAAHQKVIRETAALPKKTLLSFFAKATPSVSPVSASSSQAVAAPAPLLSLSTTATSLTVVESVTAPLTFNPALAT